MLTCTELFSDWMDFKSAFVDVNTVAWYHTTLSTIKEHFSGTAAAVIDKKIAAKFVAKIRVKLHPETAKRKIENLAACWKWGLENDYPLTRNPWDGLSRLIKAPRPERPEPFSSEEIRKILKGFEEHPRYHQYSPFVRFLFGTGCRTGEAIGLRWQDVSADCNQVAIGSQITRRKRKGTKTGTKRKFNLSVGLQTLLQGMERGKPGELIFKVNGHAIDPCNFRGRVWIPILLAAGVDYRPPYQTRSTFISHCLDKGISPANVARISGHDPVVLLRHYAGCVSTPVTPEIM